MTLEVSKFLQQYLRSSFTKWLNLLLGILFISYSFFFFWRMNDFRNTSQKLNALIIGTESQLFSWNLRSQSQFHPVVLFTHDDATEVKSMALSEGRSRSEIEVDLKANVLIPILFSSKYPEKIYVEADFYYIRNYEAGWSLIFGICCLLWFGNCHFLKSKQRVES